MKKVIRSIAIMILLFMGLVPFSCFAPEPLEMRENPQEERSQEEREVQEEKERAQEEKKALEEQKNAQEEREKELEERQKEIEEKESSKAISEEQAKSEKEKVAQEQKELEVEKKRREAEESAVEQKEQELATLEEAAKNQKTQEEMSSVQEGLAKIKISQEITVADAMIGEVVEKSNITRPQRRVDLIGTLNEAAQAELSLTKLLEKTTDPAQKETIQNGIDKAQAVQHKMNSKIIETMYSQVVARFGEPMDSFVPEDVSGLMESKKSLKDKIKELYKNTDPFGRKRRAQAREYTKDFNHLTNDWSGLETYIAPKASEVTGAQKQLQDFFANVGNLSKNGIKEQQYKSTVLLDVSPSQPTIEQLQRTFSTELSSVEKRITDSIEKLNEQLPKDVEAQNQSGSLTPEQAETYSLSKDLEAQATRMQKKIIRLNEVAQQEAIITQKTIDAQVNEAKNLYKSLTPEAMQQTQQQLEKISFNLTEQTRGMERTIELLENVTAEMTPNEIQARMEQAENVRVELKKLIEKQVQLGVEKPGLEIDLLANNQMIETMQRDQLVRQKGLKGLLTRTVQRVKDFFNRFKRDITPLGDGLEPAQQIDRMAKNSKDATTKAETYWDNRVAQSGQEVATLLNEQVAGKKGTELELFRERVENKQQELRDLQNSMQEEATRMLNIASGVSSLKASTEMVAILSKERALLDNGQLSPQKIKDAMGIDATGKFDFQVSNGTVTTTIDGKPVSVGTVEAIQKKLGNRVLKANPELEASFTGKQADLEKMQQALGEKVLNKIQESPYTDFSNAEFVGLADLRQIGYIGGSGQIGDLAQAVRNISSYEGEVPTIIHIMDGKQEAILKLPDASSDLLLQITRDFAGTSAGIQMKMGEISGHIEDLAGLLEKPSLAVEPVETFNAEQEVKVEQGGDENTFNDLDSLLGDDPSGKDDPLDTTNTNTEQDSFPPPPSPEEEAKNIKALRDVAEQNVTLEPAVATTVNKVVADLAKEVQIISETKEITLDQVDATFVRAQEAHTALEKINSKTIKPDAPAAQDAQEFNDAAQDYVGEVIKALEVSPEQTAQAELALAKAAIGSGEPALVLQVNNLVGKRSELYNDITALIKKGPAQNTGEASTLLEKIKAYKDELVKVKVSSSSEYAQQVNDYISGIDAFLDKQTNVLVDSMASKKQGAESAIPAPPAPAADVLAYLKGEKTMQELLDLSTLAEGTVPKAPEMSQEWHDWIVGKPGAKKPTKGSITGETKKVTTEPKVEQPKVEKPAIDYLAEMEAKLKKRRESQDKEPVKTGPTVVDPVPEWKPVDVLSEYEGSISIDTKQNIRKMKADDIADSFEEVMETVGLAINKDGEIESVQLDTDLSLVDAGKELKELNNFKQERAEYQKALDTLYQKTASGSVDEALAKQLAKIKGASSGKVTASTPEELQTQLDAIGKALDSRVEYLESIVLKDAAQKQQQEALNFINKLGDTASFGTAEEFSSPEQVTKKSQDMSNQLDQALQEIQKSSEALKDLDPGAKSELEKAKEKAQAAKEAITQEASSVATQVKTVQEQRQKTREEYGADVLDALDSIDSTATDEVFEKQVDEKIKSLEDKLAAFETAKSLPEKEIERLKDGIDAIKENMQNIRIKKQVENFKAATDTARETIDAIINGKAVTSADLSSIRANLKTNKDIIEKLQKNDLVGSKELGDYITDYNLLYDQSRIAQQAMVPADKATAEALLEVNQAIYTSEVDTITVDKLNALLEKLKTLDTAKDDYVQYEINYLETYIKPNAKEAIPAAPAGGPPPPPPGPPPPGLLSGPPPPPPSGPIPTFGGAAKPAQKPMRIKDMLGEIQGGTRLKSASERKLTDVARKADRGDLMAEIAKGAKLKPISNKDSGTTTPTNEPAPIGSSKFFEGALTKAFDKFGVKDTSGNDSGNEDEWD